MEELCGGDERQTVCCWLVLGGRVYDGEEKKKKKYGSENPTCFCCGPVRFMTDHTANLDCYFECMCTIPMLLTVAV